MIFVSPSLGQSQTDAKPPIERVALRKLLADGYEIKSVALTPQTVSSRIALKPDVDAVLISLQKGPQLATCWLQLASYVNGQVLDAGCIPHK